MKDYILEVKKVIPNVLCEKIISYFDHSYIDASTTGHGVNKSIRNCVTRSLLEPKTFGERLCSNAIKKSIYDCVKHYDDKFGVAPEDISQLDLLKYECNDHDAGYDFHRDFGAKSNQRHLSISVALNNDYTGGEFVFDIPNGHYTVVQNIGDAVIFPSNFMFPHQVNKIKSGTRLALIGWVI